MKDKISDYYRCSGPATAASTIVTSTNDPVPVNAATAGAQVTVSVQLMP